MSNSLQIPQQVRELYAICIFGMMVTYYVYILTNKNHTVLYTGFTDDIERRVFEHKNRLFKGFTSKYNVDKLVFFEEFTDMESAKYRESQIKRYKRDWKEKLINERNPAWRDLYDDFIIN